MGQGSSASSSTCGSPLGHGGTQWGTGALSSQLVLQADVTTHPGSEPLSWVLSVFSRWSQRLTLRPCQAQAYVHPTNFPWLLPWRHSSPISSTCPAGLAGTQGRPWMEVSQREVTGHSRPAGFSLPGLVGRYVSGASPVPCVSPLSHREPLLSPGNERQS